MGPRYCSAASPRFDLAPNDVYGYAKIGTIPAGTAAGDYTIVIRADADGTVPEVNEGDNTPGNALRVTR